MHFDSILALTDLTAHSAHVLERAALLAQHHQATLRLVHIAEGPNTLLADPLARLAQRARQLKRHHEIPVHVVARSLPLKEALAEASACTLLVMGALPHRSWKRFYLGNTLDQAIQGSPCPVLVVKQAPSQAYAQVIVVDNLSTQSNSLIDFAAVFAVPRVLKLFHASDIIDKRKQQSDPPTLETHPAHRLSSRQQARNRLTELIHELAVAPPAPQDSAQAFDIHTTDWTTLDQRATQADLVVVGQRRRALWTHVFTRSMAQCLAQSTSGDMLLVPMDLLNDAAMADKHCGDPHGPH